MSNLNRTSPFNGFSLQQPLIVNQGHSVSDGQSLFQVHVNPAITPALPKTISKLYDAIKAMFDHVASDNWGFLKAILSPILRIGDKSIETRQQDIKEAIQQIKAKFGTTQQSTALSQELRNITPTKWGDWTDNKCNWTLIAVLALASFVIPVLIAHNLGKIVGDEWEYPTDGAVGMMALLIIHAAYRNQKTGENQLLVTHGKYLAEQIALKYPDDQPTLSYFSAAQQ